MNRYKLTLWGLVQTIPFPLATWKSDDLVELQRHAVAHKDLAERQGQYYRLVDQETGKYLRCEGVGK